MQPEQPKTMHNTNAASTSLLRQHACWVVKDVKGISRHPAKFQSPNMTPTSQLSARYECEHQISCHSHDRGWFIELQEIAMIF